mgnify:CR=1 FL=1
MKNKKIALFLILAMTAALIGGIVLVQKSQETRKGAFYGGISAGIWPDFKEVGVDETFDFYLTVTPDTYLVTGAEMNLGFDKSILELTGIEFDNLFTGPKRISSANENGELNIITITTADRSELHREAFNLAKLTFKAIATGSAAIDRVGEYKIVGSRGQEGVIDRTLELKSFTSATVKVSEEGPTPTETPIISGGPTPTEPPEGWPTLNFRIKPGGTSYRVDDQQITVSNIPDQKVKVVVKKGTFRKEFEDVVVSFDEQAVGAGSLKLFGVVAGENYAVLIKGPVHLARRFCYDQQKEHCWLGEEDVTLVPGENDYSWTDLELEPGDINGDGLIDSTDFSQLKQALGVQGEGTKEDLNFNGIVNPQDVVFFLETLSTKYEEEI